MSASPATTESAATPAVTEAPKPAKVEALKPEAKPEQQKPEPKAEAKLEPKAAMHYYRRALVHGSLGVVLALAGVVPTQNAPDAPLVWMQSAQAGTGAVVDAEQVAALGDAMQLGPLLAVIREEGLAYGDGLDTSMLDGAGGVSGAGEPMPATTIDHENSGIRVRRMPGVRRAMIVVRMHTDASTSETIVATSAVTRSSQSCIAPSICALPGRFRPPASGVRHPA